MDYNNKDFPILFVSHGSTMMLGEESVVSRDWEEQGRNAERNGVQGVIILGAHWEKTGQNLVHVSIKEPPGMNPISWVAKEKYENYRINCSKDLGTTVGNILTNGGINVVLDDTDDWIHDSLIPLKWMFPKKCPPVTLLSINSKYDAAFHAKIGKLLSHLRSQKILLIGTGGAVHNLYRNYWPQIVIHRNNFAQEVPPDQWALDFRDYFYDAIHTNPCTGKASIREGVLRLMHNPRFRDAHGTDDHYMSACFVAGASKEREVGYLTSEVWELQNMGNSQYIIGSW
ncbi:uncharacterized protein AC631_03453 [Debaryomyces fabryi]|uniref:Extradiol ring-cleavage dioxygenase class III enzyme subunit B domain-containing protein n=1 Tax=Debaryomyces fabryi TaxID=58627 RepID=A0A0V1PX12_9ASCO|nr:uncharacterized protein AC631_03453 [Debaryomyces fabryi]KSA00804.1 hypothetical protein AC631_03453 [Debaryomyces fabryi]CUM55095.1 unnamed protein product [Debaryomyces fabryi]